MKIKNYLLLCFLVSFFLKTETSLIKNVITFPFKTLWKLNHFDILSFNNKFCINICNIKEFQIKKTKFSVITPFYIALFYGIIKNRREIKKLGEKLKNILPKKNDQKISITVKIEDSKQNKNNNNEQQKTKTEKFLEKIKLHEEKIKSVTKFIRIFNPYTNSLDLFLRKTKSITGPILDKSHYITEPLSKIFNFISSKAINPIVDKIKNKFLKKTQDQQIQNNDKQASFCQQQGQQTSSSQDNDEQVSSQISSSQDNDEQVSSQISSGKGGQLLNNIFKSNEEKKIEVSKNMFKIMLKTFVNCFIKIKE